MKLDVDEPTATFERRRIRWRVHGYIVWLGLPEQKRGVAVSLPLTKRTVSRKVCSTVDL